MELQKQPDLCDTEIFTTVVRIWNRPVHDL